MCADPPRLGGSPHLFPLEDVVRPVVPADQKFVSSNNSSAFQFVHKAEPVSAPSSVPASPLLPSLMALSNSSSFSQLSQLLENETPGFFPEEDPVISLLKGSALGSALPTSVATTPCLEPSRSMMSQQSLMSGGSPQSSQHSHQNLGNLMAAGNSPQNKLAQEMYIPYLDAFIVERRQQEERRHDELAMWEEHQRLLFGTLPPSAFGTPPPAPAYPNMSPLKINTPVPEFINGPVAPSKRRVMKPETETVKAHQRKQFYKTRLCPHFFSLSRYCRRRSHCNYAHSKAELRPSINLAKTKLCEAFAAGGCDQEDCPFAHGLEELRSTPSFFKTLICKCWTAGCCPAGASCRHAHGEIERLAAVTMSNQLFKQAGKIQNSAQMDMATTNLSHQLLNRPPMQQLQHQGMAPYLPSPPPPAHYELSTLLPPAGFIWQD